MMGIMVRYRYGRTELTGVGVVSASQLQQAIDSVQGELREVFGQYRWMLDGDCYHGYVVKAVSLDKPGTWIEGRGKTPRAAARDCCAVRMILGRHGVTL